MKYRRFGKLDWEASILGFGAMRLPTVGDDAARIDEPRAAKMIRYAIDNGVNYIDTAYVYHRTNSETFLGKALGDGYREKVKLTSKMPTWYVTSQQDMDKYLNEQLAKLRTDHLDFYLLHGLTKERWQKLNELKVLSWAEKKIDEGKFNHLGFSFHDDLETFKNIINSYDGWALSQIQYNYVDSDYQAGTEGMKFAASKGLAVIVMEPIAGGKLAMKMPKPIQDLWEHAEVKRTPAEWALIWVWNQPEVSIVLSGMSTMDQVVENLNTADHASPGMLTKRELALINRIAAKYKQLGFIACTGCRYCQPCPEGVNIPEIMSLYNEFFIKGRDDVIKAKYWEHITPESQAKRCKRCGNCEKLCPQQLPIKDILSNVAFIFEQQA